MWIRAISTITAHRVNLLPFAYAIKEKVVVLGRRSRITDIEAMFVTTYSR